MQDGSGRQRETALVTCGYKPRGSISMRSGELSSASSVLWWSSTAGGTTAQQCDDPTNLATAFDVNAARPAWATHLYAELYVFIYASAAWTYGHHNVGGFELFAYGAPPLAGTCMGVQSISQDGQFMIDRNHQNVDILIYLQSWIGGGL